jgi:hypothetical protein
MRSFSLTFLFSLLLCSRSPAMSFDGPPPEHDWTVRVGYRHFGIGGDSRGSYIHYGPDFVWVRMSFWQLVTLTSLSALAIGAAGWFITRRHANAA